MTTEKSMKIRAVLILIFSLILIFVAFQFQSKLSEFKTLGLIGIFLINFFGSATIFLPAPAFVSVVAGGIVYPPFLVALAAAVGGALGEIVGLSLGHSGRAIFIKDHHTFYFKIKHYFRKFSDVIIFVGALIPNPLFDVVGILAGVFAVHPWRFFVLVFIGRLFRNILLAYVGTKL